MKEKTQRELLELHLMRALDSFHLNPLDGSLKCYEIKWR